MLRMYSSIGISFKSYFPKYVTLVDIADEFDNHDNPIELCEKIM